MEQSNLNYQHHHQSDNKPIGIDHPINQPSSSNETSISTSLAVLHHPLIESTPNSTSSSSPSSNSKPAHVRRPNWTTTEDEQLCRSWLENSLDPVKNTIQKGTQFWHRVAQDFTNRGPGHIERNKDHVRNRWQLLQAKVIKFATCFSKIQALHPTGKTQDELVADAMRLYEREEAHKFTFYSSWLILRNSQRWIQWTSNIGHKRLSTGLQPLSDIAVSPHSTVSLLDSDESPTIDQPLNRLMMSRKLSISQHRQHSPALSSIQQQQQESQLFEFQSPHLTHHNHHQQQQHLINDIKPPLQSPSEPQHVESSDRLLALAMKRKADVQEAALEVQLLNIDPEKITDPLRKEVYMMKMEEIRDRYKAKRSRASSRDNEESTHRSPNYTINTNNNLQHNLMVSQSPESNRETLEITTPDLMVNPNRLLESSSSNPQNNQLTPPHSSPRQLHRISTNQIDRSTTHPDLLSQSDLAVVYHTPPPQ